VCSGGGHLAQLLVLRSFWGEHERSWVTLDRPDTRQRLSQERVYWSHQATNRRPLVVASHLRRAHQVLRDERPDVVITNGAGIALPYVAAASIMGIRTIFIEVYDRVEVPSLTGALLAPWVDAVVVQWPEQLDLYPHARLLGPCL
jgi:UDP-N-acetylglucosamine:LPS N-acetylglucosamine transferase